MNRAYKAKIFFTFKNLGMKHEVSKILKKEKIEIENEDKLQFQITSYVAPIFNENLVDFSILDFKNSIKINKFLKKKKLNYKVYFYSIDGTLIPNQLFFDFSYLYGVETKRKRLKNFLYEMNFKK